MINNTLTSAITLPVTIDNIHESCFKSSAVLKYVRLMLKRKDSHETISDLIEAAYAPEFITSHKTNESKVNASD